MRHGIQVLFAATVAFFAAPVRGHVILIDPNGGEEMEVCSVFTVTWQIQVGHDLQNWDLWYSEIGPAGPWIVIALDLPPGDPAPLSVHTYDWTVPADVDDSAWLQVRMDNSGTDYYDVSVGSFSILPLPTDVNGDYAVNVLDLIDLLLCFGQPADPPCDKADFDGNGTVNVLDLIQLLLDFGESCP